MGGQAPRARAGRERERESPGGAASRGGTRGYAQGVVWVAATVPTSAHALYCAHAAAMTEPFNRARGSSDSRHSSDSVVRGSIFFPVEPVPESVTPCPFSLTHGPTDKAHTHAAAAEVAAAAAMAKAVGLPWPRGNPPKFPSPIKKHAAHWNVGAQVRCAQCGAVSNCEHKDRHARNVNQKWEDEVEGRDNRPGFFRESELFRSQVKEQPQLGIGEPLPVGMRRGWEAYPGNDDVRVDSPRRHGEWRLVFMPRDKSKDHRAAEMMQDPPKRSRSTNPVAHKQREARKKWDEENIELALDRDVLRSVSMTPGGRSAQQSGASLCAASCACGASAAAAAPCCFR